MGKAEEEVEAVFYERRLRSPSFSGRARPIRVREQPSPYVTPELAFLPPYDLGVKADKLNVSFPLDLGDAVRAAAERAGEGLSGWLADAAAAKLRAEALDEYLDDYEAEHGAFTTDELTRASADLGLPAPSTSDPVA